MRLRKNIFALTLVFLSGLCIADEIETFAVVSDYWCPFNCTPNSDKEGFGIEFLRAIYEPLGIKIEYTLKGWDEAIADTREGRYNAAISAYKTDAEDFVFPENPYAYSIACFFVKPSNNWVYDGVSSLKYQKIGAIKGYSYGVNIDNFFNNNKIFMVSGAEPLKELFQALRNGSITTIIEDEAVFKYVNRTAFPDIQTKEVGCQYPGSLYVAYSPANPDSKKYAELFDRGFINLKRSGKYREILNRYGLGD